MDLSQASVFLSGSVLIMLGFIALAAGIIVINNLVHKFWKPVTIFTRDSFTLFGGNQNGDPLSVLTQEEYDKLVKHLEKIRKDEKPKIEPKID